MPDIFVISDTHWRHRPYVKRRGFASVEAMDQFMFEQWNQVVKPEDQVYHLGDVVVGRNRVILSWMKETMPKLNGEKILILGNHDNPRLMRGFASIQLWKELAIGGQNFALSHAPLHEDTLDEPRFKGNALNVHGHIHASSAPTPRHICVCVEQTNYAPINIEELLVP